MTSHFVNDEWQSLPGGFEVNLEDRGKLPFKLFNNIPHMKNDISLIV